jgi:RNA polymerase sigma-70 factor (ECF subfamily)
MYFCEDLHDVTLVAQVRAGDMDVFRHLIEHYQRGLYTVALAMLGDVEEARRATRTALLHTYAWLSTRDPDYAFFSSTYRLLVSDCLDILMHRPSLPAGTGADIETEGSAVLFQRSSTDEQRCRMRAEILQLLPERRTIVVLRYLAGFSYEETCIILRVPSAWVRSQLHAARQQLGERLLAWSPRGTFSVEDETLLQGAIDGVLDYDECAAHERLLARRVDAPARAVALGELAQLLHALTSAEPPCDLARQVIAQIRAMTRSSRATSAT